MDEYRCTKPAESLQFPEAISSLTRAREWLGNAADRSCYCEEDNDRDWCDCHELAKIIDDAVKERDLQYTEAFMGDGARGTGPMTPELARLTLMSKEQAR